MIRAHLVEHNQHLGNREIRRLDHAGVWTITNITLQDLLTDLQHEHREVIISTLHAHLDHDNCLEVLAVRGKAVDIKKLVDEMIAATGKVKHGKSDDYVEQGKDFARLIREISSDSLSDGLTMHVPDGFLDAKTALISGGVSVVGVGYSLRELRKHLPPRKVPLLGLSAAFVFAAQMLNFPVAGGTSGHLIGGVLTAVLLGPCAATVVLTAVLLVQCFMFADGGVTALGANIFNMGIVASFTGYVIYRFLRRCVPGERGLVLAVAFASWVSTVLAAIVCAGQLALSETVPWSIALPAMTDVHMLIGIGEGLITSLVVVAIARTRPELIEGNTPVPQDGRMGVVLVYGSLISLGLALFVSPFACAWPDGLEQVAVKVGFEHRAVTTKLIQSPIPDYHLPGIHSIAWGTALAGCIGTVVAFGLALLLARVLVPEPAVEKQSRV